MKSPASWTSAAALAAALFVLPGASARASAPDSLTLQAPSDVKVWSVYNRQSKGFAVYVTWRDSPDSCAAFVNPPDTTGWGLGTPPDLLSIPAATGPYTGDIDRTVQFNVGQQGGEVGVDAIKINFSVRLEEYFTGDLTIPPGYEPDGPDPWIPVIFDDLRTSPVQKVDFGLRVRFSEGRIDGLGSFVVGLEDFEGFHVWRGIEADGSDLEIIGELSKEEAFKGGNTGGNVVDSLYYYDIIPTLRTSPPWLSPFGAIDCLGTRIDLALEADQLFWFDCSASNGFTYYYAVTTFDRDYTPKSSQQGLVKFDHCEVPVDEWDGKKVVSVPYPCRDELRSVKVEVAPQSDLYKVYVVPNPVRMGSSRLTTDNYHNFPDGFVRFVNVPADCVIKVFTVSGDLVWETTHSGGLGNVEWDIRNGTSGEEVASGVYVFRLESNGDSVYGRIVVIR